MNPGLLRYLLLCLLLTVTDLLGDEQGSAGNEQEIAEIKVVARRVANLQPAGTYPSLTTTLRFDPQTELQSRGLAEGQSDVTVRGGIFENTGFAIGATTIIDPQTGHYSAGLPIDPALLSPPGLKTGIDNAIAGFNSNIATVAYSMPVIRDGGNILLGFGGNKLWFTSLRLAETHTRQNGNNLALAISGARSEGDGTVPDGDHEFSRYNIHIQHSRDNTQTDVLFSYQDKFYAWPGAYTGFAFLAETDHTKTRLIHAGHRRENDRGWVEFSAYYRGLEDDYDFDRTTQESGTPGSFEHETRVYSAGFQGSYRHGALDWRYGGQLTSDKLVFSTDLTEGNFNSRKYIKLSLVPTLDFEHAATRTFSARAGATLDASNRDSTEVSPLVGLLLQTRSPAHNTIYGIEYASTSQLPGYTALNARPGGLFGGNPDLGRETARQISLSIRRASRDWTGSLTLFHRSDDNLVDWTYSVAAPFSRQANAVDLGVSGLEMIFTRQWTSLNLIAGYTYLDKDSEYDDSDVDASFYALNFARHRATLALSYQLTAQVELRLDNEYRVQEFNPLRTSDDEAYLASFAVAWVPARINGLAITLVADNLGDSDFQYFPGTPAVGRQLSVSAGYQW